MLSHNLSVKILPQQNEVYNVKFKTNVVWRQKLKDPHFEATTSPKWRGNSTYGTYTISNNKLTYTITTKNANEAIIQDSVSFTKGHIYLLSCWLTVSEDQVVGVYTGNSAVNMTNIKANTRTRIFNVFKSNVTSTRTHYIYPARNGGLSVGGTAVLEDACLYDLTEMFGAGKENLGRFSFLSNFPNNYYDYNVEGDLVPFTIPVYGGSLNVKTGELTITKYNVDLGYLYWQYSACRDGSLFRKYCDETLFENVSSSADLPDAKCGCYKVSTGNDLWYARNGIAIGTTGKLYVYDEHYNTDTDMVEFAEKMRYIVTLVSGKYYNPCTICYNMPEPIIYNLTPSEVRTLLDNNKITSNAAELQFTYVNNQNETVALTGSNEYNITDGVFNRSATQVTQMIEAKQDLRGQDYAFIRDTGGSENLATFDRDGWFEVFGENGYDLDITYRVPLPDYGHYYIKINYEGTTALDYGVKISDNDSYSLVTFKKGTFGHTSDNNPSPYRFKLFMSSNDFENGRKAYLKQCLISKLRKNLFDEEYPNISTSIAYMSIFLGQGTYVMSTTCPRSGSTSCSLFFLSGKVTTGANNNVNGVYDGKSITVTASGPEDGWVTVAYRIAGGNNPSNYNTQIEVGSTATTYEPIYIPDYMPYENLCPLFGTSESVITVEGTPVSDSESERRLKTITRPAFQWDVGLKLKFEGYTFADGTLCQFDNKLTTFSQNEYIVNNECTIPESLLDENCQGDIVAYINVSGNDYDVVVYEVYIPVIKRPKPENFLRPAIDLPQAIVASFADGADDVPLEKLNLPLLPKQDLHGYDYPWVGGGGKNKLNYDAWKANPIIRGTAVWKNNGVTLTATDNDCYTNFNPSGSAWDDARIPVKEGDVVTLSWEEDTNTAGGCYIFGNGQTVNYRGENNINRKTCVLTIASGITFVTIRMGVQNAGDTISYKNVMVQVNSSDTQFVYAPYENICPITGYTEANVMRTGRNLFDLNYLSATDITIEDGVVSGTAAKFHANFGGNAGGIPIPNLPQGQLTLSFDIKTDGNVSTSGNGVVVRFHYTNGAWTGIMKTNNTTEYSHEVMVSNASKVVDYIYISYSTTSNNIWYFKNIQLELSSSSTIYTPYAGHAYNIPFTHEGPNVFTRVGETENSYINSSGNISTSQAYCLSDYIEVEECKRYVFDASTANVTSGVHHAFYNAEKTRTTFTSCSQEFFIPPTGAKYVRLSYRKDAGASDFHISIGTVPHGILDVKSGILTVDYAYINDLSNYHFARSSASLTYIFNTLQLTNMKAPTTSVGRLEGCASSGYKMALTTGVSANMTPYSMLRNNARIYFRNDDYNDNSTGFRASLSGHQAIYELTSPCTYQLTPTEVKTLLGYNNIWADTGEVEVSYYPDPYLHFET